MSQAAYTEDMAFARRHLVEADLAALWAEGRAMTLDEAVADALAEQ